MILGQDYGRGYLGFALTMADYESFEEQTWIFHGPIEAMRYTDAPVLRLGNDDLPGFGNALQDAEVSDTTAIFQVQPLGEVWIVEEGVLHRRAGVRSAVPGSPQEIALVGRHAIWNEWRNDVRIAHATADEAASVYLSVEGKRVTVATDGVDLAWLQGPWTPGVGFSESPELWTAPYVRNPADLAPRRVLERFDDGTLVGVIGAGMWAEGGNEVTLIDLETGIRREIAQPPLALFLGHPRWVTEEEIGISGRWSGSTGYFNTFFRLAVSSAVVVD